MSKFSNNEVINIKIILLGDVGTGKTNLINAYFNREFDINSKSTLSPQYSQKKININGINYLIDVWDTAGQEKYKSISKIFIKGSNIVIFVYDITNEKSFINLDYWVNSVEEILWENQVFGLVANKMDLFLQEKVEKERGIKYSKEIGALFCQTSGKEDKKGFQIFIEKLIKIYIDNNKEILGSGEKLELNKNNKSRYFKCK